ncbi:Uncharacterized protein BM_BM12847 [Brugia malayi]|uniref:Bm12847 n=2 Tax=Brugia TaxID=6278 RepID=A0A0J9Y5A9_BRUMA|nr:Uncharacterized protein BM_BM12847 [Brugia malayi]CDQ02142.1 Bm12847 [Brugia malayi]VIO96222.1 Uncharacterized protein BM_BM12847 [Brugia malayi]
MTEHVDTKGLSSALLQMKFMQRTRIRLEEEAKRKSEQKLQKRFLKKDDKKLSKGPEAVEPTVKSENRYELLENLSFGRMSFKGFNPEVEKLMKYYEDIKGCKVSDEVNFDIGQDITDYELAASVFSAKAKGNRKYLNKHEMDERSLIDEINEQPLKRKRRDDGRPTQSKV